jgi:hypothetical protein
VLDRFCIPCHNNKLKTAGLALDELDLVRVGRDADAWEKVAHKLRTHEMPPPGRPRPDPETYARVASSLEASLEESDAKPTEVNCRFCVFRQRTTRLWPGSGGYYF